MKITEVRKCLERKDGIKMVIVPKKSEIKKNDYVGLVKMGKEEIQLANKYKEVKKND